VGTHMVEHDPFTNYIIPKSSSTPGT
jgi:hypothetical protein